MRSSASDPGNPSKMDWESHRVLTRTGKFRGLIFRLGNGRFAMKLPIGSLGTCVAGKVSFFDSMKSLESEIRKRGWRLEMVRHFT